MGSEDLRFDLPEIKLPTLYEVRQLSQPTWTDDRDIQVVLNLPQPGVPQLDLGVETRGPDGPETRRSRRRRQAWPWLNLVPILGYPDPPCIPRIRLFRWLPG